MSRNLNPEEKEKQRNKYDGHIFFRLVNQSCKKYERELRVFRLSPDDVFMETLNVLDDLKAPDRNNDDLCDTLWDDLYCEFRDRGNDIPEEELNKAVAIVLSMVTYCLALLDAMRYNGINGKLMLSLNGHYKGYNDIQGFIHPHAIKVGMNDLKDWLTGYMQCDTYLYDEVVDYLEEKGVEEEEANEETSKIAPNKVRAQLLLEILKQCGMGLDKQDMTKVARLVGFITGASSEKIRQQLSRDGALILNAKTHQKHVDEVNKILSEMKSKIKLNCE